MKHRINVVWLKRDIRTQDHRALAEAEASDLPYIIIFLFEPTLMQYDDSDVRHWQFNYGSLQDMSFKLKVYRGHVNICHGEATEVFAALQEQYEIASIFSYQESGTEITWQRDKAVKKWCKKFRIQWLEYPRDGIQRGIKNRDRWDKKWFITMNSPTVDNKYTIGKIIRWEHRFPIPQEVYQKLIDYPATFQPPGESNAWKYLQSFAENRGHQYHRLISKPKESRTSCGRVSPYLAWGNLSIRQTYQYIKKHPCSNAYKRAYQGFLTRLKWHCHFIQKFEVECGYETLCINRGYESLAYENNDQLLEAWKSCNPFQSNLYIYHGR